MTDDWTPRRLAAREQMRAALYWYARAIDRGETAFLARAFHEGATVDCGAYTGDAPGFGAMLEGRGQKVLRSVHMIGNMLVDFRDDAHAFAESYCLAIEEFLSKTPDEPGLNRLVRVRYADDFECRDGAWKIVHHLIVVDHVMPAEPAIVPDGFFTGPQGGRGAEDPILQRRAGHGIAWV